MAVVVLVVSIAAARAVPAWRSSDRYAAVRRNALPLAALIALTATAGSLYYSEVVGFVPCRLCWWQRAGMYPLAPILGIAAIGGAVRIGRWVWPLVAWGGGVALYHTVIQRLPALEVTSCDPTSPCTAWWVREFGFVSIPLLSLIAFIGVAVLLAVAAGSAEEVHHGRFDSDEERHPDPGPADGGGGGVRTADAGLAQR